LTGDVVTISNGLIVGVTNLSRDWARALVDVPLPLGVDVARANDLLRKVGEDAFQDDTLLALYLQVRPPPASSASGSAPSPTTVEP
jgi:small conductance mechanosensitive channel